MDTSGNGCDAIFALCALADYPGHRFGHARRGLHPLASFSGWLSMLTGIVGKTHHSCPFWHSRQLTIVHQNRERCSNADPFSIFVPRSIRDTLMQTRRSLRVELM